MSGKKIYLSMIVAVLVLMIGAVAVQASSPYAVQTGPCYYKTGVMNWGNIIPSFCSPVSYTPPLQCCTNCNHAEFIRDVTIPDGSYIAPGGYFTKTWRIRNVSPSTWPLGTKLIFSSGSQMGAPASVNFPYAVAPGKSVDISVSMRAPSTPGSYKGNWMIQTPNGAVFGVGCNGQVPVWVSITTTPVSTCNCYGYVNCNCGDPCWGSGTCASYYPYYPNYPYQNVNPKYSQPKWLTRNPYCNNKIRAINDITIPDGTEFDPGTAFRKTWSMKNGGTCVWNEGYSLVFTGGDGMGGVQSVPLPKKVYPGETVRISIDLKSPQLFGNYRGYYMLRDDLGYTFGYGSYANSAFWVDIKVTDAATPEPTVAPTAVPTAAPDATPVPGQPTPPAPPAPVIVPTATPTTDPTLEDVEEPLIMDDEGDPNYGSDALEPNEMQKSLPHNECGSQHIEVQLMEPDIYNISWFLTNAGAAVWTPEKYRVVNAGISDNLVLIGSDIVLPKTKTGEQAMINISAKIRNLNDQSENWLKFYINDGIESFCEVYFPLSRK